MQINEKMHGFLITRIRPIPEFEAELVEMTHEYSHAKLAWVKRKEQNKTFSIGFRTLPEDSTGVFHILEHSVLEGSEKYPLREPFAELLKSSVNTFLNAMTFSDKTMYPVASRNNQDFINLISVYLDAVFHPVALRDRRIFEQEGWHYEFDENNEPIYQGIVLNEMKGATSDVDDIASDKLTALMYCDTPYRFNSGGDPAVIPNLTHEQFCAAHSKYYHPSNAYLFLDGDVDPDTVLPLLDKELCFTPPRSALESIPLQTPVGGKCTAEYELGADEDETNKDRLCIGKIFASFEKCEKIMASHILCNVLAETNASPLAKAIIEQELAEDVSVGLMEDCIQIAFCVDYINTDRTRFDKLRKTTDDVIEKLLQNGLDKEEIRAQLKRFQFMNMNPEEPCGVALAILIMRSWLYGGDPITYLSRKEVLETLEAKIDTDYFENLLKELFSGEWCELALYPSKTYGDGLRKAEKERIRKETAHWDDAARAEVQQRLEVLKLWQSTPDSPQALAALPVLTLDDLRQPPKYIDTRIEKKGDVTVLRHSSGKQGIVHISMYFQIPDLQTADYIKLSVMKQLIGKLPTKQHDLLSLQRLLKNHVGKRKSTIHATAVQEGCIPAFTVVMSMLESEVETALQLNREMLLETDFNHPEMVKPLLLQRLDSIRQAIINHGSSYAKDIAAAHFFPEHLVLEQLSGVATYRYLKQLAENMEEEFPRFLQWTQKMVATLFCTARLTCSITGSDSFATPDWSCFFPQGMPSSCTAFTETANTSMLQGIAIPSQVSFSALIADMRKHLPQFSGQIYVLRNILSHEYLWNEIRVKNGAYGAGFIGTRRGLIGGSSFRDPTPAITLDVIKQSGSFLREMLGQNPDIERFIIGALPVYDPELSVAAQGQIADMEYFTGITVEMLHHMREETLNTTAQDLLALCDKLDACLQEQPAACITGPENVLRAIDGIFVEHL